MRTFLFLLLTIAICVSGQAPVPAKVQISPSEILEKNLIATGGLEAHKALETLVASGEIHLNTTQRIGDYKFSYKAPDNHMLEIRTAEHGTTWTGQRGKRAFARSSLDLLAVPAPLELCRQCLTDDVHTWIMESNWLMLLRGNLCHTCDIELIGMGEVDKRLAYALRFTSKKGGDPFVCFYDRETFLLVRIDRIDRFETGPHRTETMHKVESIFRDYREQGGIKLPFVIAIASPKGDVVCEVSKMKTNEPVKDSVFE